MAEATVQHREQAASDDVKSRSTLHKLLLRPEFGSLLGAIAIFIFFLIIADPFRGANSQLTVLYASSTIGIMAVGVALLMIGGEFDISAGVAVTTSSLTASMLAYEMSANVWVGIFASLLLALFIGFINGYIMIRTGIPSFLVTLGTFLMLQGLNLGVTNVVTGQVASPSISNMDGFATAELIFASELDVGGVSVEFTVFWWILFVAIATWVLLRTKIGNWIYAVGGDAESARAVGVPVAKTKIGLFMTVGFCSWFSGMHLLFSFNTVQSGSGLGNELIYISAAVIGGCLLTGGYGTAVGAAIGALVYGMASQGIVLAGWDPSWVQFFLGAMLLLATVLNTWVRNQTQRR